MVLRIRSLPHTPFSGPKLRSHIVHPRHSGSFWRPWIFLSFQVISGVFPGHLSQCLWSGTFNAAISTERVHSTAWRARRVPQDPRQPFPQRDEPSLRAMGLLCFPHLQHPDIPPSFISLKLFEIEKAPTAGHRIGDGKSLAQKHPEHDDSTFGGVGKITILGVLLGKELNLETSSRRKVSCIMV